MPSTSPPPTSPLIPRYRRQKCLVSGQVLLENFPAKLFACAKHFFPSISNMAAAADERNRSLKQALIESLTAILSPDQQARQLAEEQLKVLEVTEGKIIPLF